MEQLALNHELSSYVQGRAAEAFIELQTDCHAHVSEFLRH